MSVLFDTTVLIDILRVDPSAVEYVLELSETPAGSEVSRAEVIRGLRSSERAEAERLFLRLRWVAVDEPIARQAGEFGRRFRRSHTGIALADLIIAATAETLALDLATTNVRQFPMFRGLKPPYRYRGAR